jgi:predicted negative regulator of RcsB-dependent stress response
LDFRHAGLKSAAVADKDKAARDESDEDLLDKADDEQQGEGKGAKASADDPEVDRDAAAERMASALGVDEGVDEAEGEDAGPAVGEGGEGGDKPADAPPPNRSQRRKDDALARRRKRRGGAEKEAEAAEGAEATQTDDDLPRDRNARARELLKRRREEAKTGPTAAPGLDAGEMVDDALARMTASAGKWVRTNLTMIQVVVVGAVLITVGVVFYLDNSEAKLGEASDGLAKAVAAERGRVLAEDKRTDEEKEGDPTLVYASEEERSKAALDAYAKVGAEHPGTGAAILAKLGEAGVKLDQGQWDAALESFSSVLASPLAGADLDVKGRAVEGQAFAREGKGDLDGALSGFKELEGIDARGYKELALYHQARIHVAKGDKDKAKELLKQAREKLATPSPDGDSFQFLEAVVDEELRALDPSAVPSRPSLSGPKGSSLTPEELQKLLRQAQEAGQKKAGEHAGE